MRKKSSNDVHAIFGYFLKVHFRLFWHFLGTFLKKVHLQNSRFLRHPKLFL